MNKYRILFLGLICLFCMEAVAQKERKFIRKGNGLFEGSEFENSEVEYRKALDKKLNSYEAGFNLGDALYKQKKYDEALKQFQALTLTEKDPKKMGELYYNIGNTLLMNRKIDESIEAYKQSLRYFPDSKETKYNLEYARKMKEKQEQEEKQKQNQQNKDNKDQQNQDQKDQDKKDQNKEQDQKDQQNKDQQNQQQKQDDQQEKKGDPKEQQNKISEQDAQRLLEALENDEKKVQEKVQKEKAKALKAKRTKIKKDW